MWNNGYNPMFWGGFGSIFMIIFWVIIAAGIVYFIKWSFDQSGGSSAPRGNNALEILKERYAKGEINKQEFEEKKKDLA
jgi:putative membrane protein